MQIFWLDTTFSTLYSDKNSSTRLFEIFLERNTRAGLFAVYHKNRVKYCILSRNAQVFTTQKIGLRHSKNGRFFPACFITGSNNFRVTIYNSGGIINSIFGERVR